MAIEPQSSILIVDDTPINIKVLQRILQRAGFQVFVAEDGASALCKVAQMAPDLILLDILMPGINGFETCKRLKTSPLSQDIPVIFMTSLTHKIDRMKGFEVGAVDYITRPFCNEEVLARVTVHVELYQLTKNLEQRVTERTKELSQALVERNQALQELKEAQTQLVQGEKMSSLGQMVAGIAHEINNPINFIHANLHHAHSYIQNLLELLNLYQLHTHKPNPEITAYSQEIDLEYLQQDLPSLLASMHSGTERIQEIISSLGNFARLNEAKWKAVDLHQGIDNTLMFLGSRLQATATRPEIEIRKQYGNLPQVECYAGQINQVFMNLLVNAIDAIELKIQGQEKFSPCICIETEFDAKDNEIAIQIQDNGQGIPLEVQTKIFDHFFTTKPVGQGKGLGLAISYEIIVQQHRGKLVCDSAPGQGAKFVIKLPFSSTLTSSSSNRFVEKQAYQSALL